MLEYLTTEAGTVECTRLTLKKTFDMRHRENKSDKSTYRTCTLDSVFYDEPLFLKLFGYENTFLYEYNFPLFSKVELSISKARRYTRTASFLTRHWRSREKIKATT